jgi:hypothetical protein
MMVGLLMILASGPRPFRRPGSEGDHRDLILTVLIVLCANLWSWPTAFVWIAFGAAATTTVLSGFQYVYLVSKNPAAP